MPGREYNVGSGYRYGFNGKENDKDAGVGIQDYGMRIYDVRLGKFLSVDPLTKSYSELTPYQFASNRPIDGIDLDGLEYATFNILVDSKSGTVTSIMVTKDYELKNKDTRGAGVQYNIIDSKTGKVKSTEFKKNLYGIYQGSDNPKLPTVGESYKKTDYDYSLEPIDETDAAAKQHDKDYDKDELEGVGGVIDDRSTQANVKYIKKAQEIIKKYENKENDQVTGKPVTKEAKEAAEFGKKWFIKAEWLKGKNPDGTKKEKKPGAEYDSRHKD